MRGREAGPSQRAAGFCTPGCRSRARSAHWARQQQRARSCLPGWQTCVSTLTGWADPKQNQEASHLAPRSPMAFPLRPPLPGKGLKIILTTHRRVSVFLLLANAESRAFLVIMLGIGVIPGDEEGATHPRDHHAYVPAAPGSKRPLYP